MRTHLFRSLLIFLLAAVSFLPAQASPWQGKVSPQVMDALAQGETDFLVVLDEQADLSAAAALPTKQAKGQFVYDTLTKLAARTQAPILAVMADAGAEYQPYWIANLIWARGDAQIVQTLASRNDVAFIAANPAVPVDVLPEPQMPDEQSPNAIEWNILKVNADDVWGAGFNGYGVVIGGQDTGYQWDHPALKNQYRGWNGFSANHDYDWHDAIHETGSSCGADSPVPCDDHGHGTHTMGTMVGDDGGTNQIGMAPGARWIGCRNMNAGVGTPTTYTECFEWFVAPTRVDGTLPRPDLAPDVISNSWGCPPSEGCDLAAIQAMQIVVGNVRVAGIMVVVSAGNNGSSCNTVDDPPAVYDASFSVGSTDSSDNISSFSSRGPADYTGLAKPDISAPGSGIRSSVPGGGYGSMSGTSMASPHVAGDVALLISAFPDLRGDVDTIEDLIRQSALPRTTTQNCGGVPGSSIPNNTYGWGRIDAIAAYQLARTHTLTVVKDAPATIRPGQPLTYTLTVSHAGFLPTHAVVLTDTLPVATTFITATLPHTLLNGTITWNLGDLASEESRSVTLVVQPDANVVSIVVNDQYRAQSQDVPQGAGGPAVITQIMEQWALSKQAPAQVAYGEPITYTLTVTNESAVAPTSSLVLTDTIPVNTNFITATLPYTLTGNVVEWGLGQLAADDSRTLTLVVLPDSDAGEEIINETYGVYSLEMTQTISGQPVVTYILPNIPNLPNLPSLSKQAPAQVAYGEPITYTLIVTNESAVEPTTSLVLTDTIPVNTSFITATLPYTLTGDVVEWGLGHMAAESSRTLTLVVLPDADAGGEIVNEYYGVRSLEVTQTVSGAPVVTHILDHLSLSKEAPAQVGLGEWITYTLTITNNHFSQPSLPLVLTDTLPTGTTFIAASLPYTLTGDVVTWNFPALAPGQVQMVTLTVLAPETVGVVTNSQYGLRTDDFSIQIGGQPVSTWVLWRIFLPLIYK